MISPTRWLAKNDVHIWLIKSHHPLADGELQACEALLDRTERWRLQQFLLQGPRSEYLMSRAFVRSLLAEYTGIPAQDWQFSANQYGRPEIVSPAAFRHLNFNLSHTEGLLACAISLDRTVGVDVEKVNQAIDQDELAPLIFAPPELARLAAEPPHQKQATFFELWTLKEAYLKARGTGFSIAPDTVWFKRVGDTPVITFVRESTDNPALWQFLSAVATENHWLAVGASQAENEKINFNVRWTTSVTAPELHRLPSQDQL